MSGMKGNQGAIAETIENNVRSTIIKEQLTDPAYYEKMSALLDEIIAARKAKAIDYEEYLKRIAELAKKVTAGLEEDTHELLKRSPALRAVYNSLKKDAAQFHAAAQAAPGDTGDPVLNLAIRVDRAVKDSRPDNWRGHGPKENTIKAALLSALSGNVDAVVQIFPIIVAQREY